MFFVNRAGILAVGVLFPILGILVTVLRFVGRRHKKPGLGLDDWLILPALILMICCSSLFIAGFATHTLGTHSPPQDLIEVVLNDSPNQVLLEKLEISSYLIQPLALGFTKLSICFFYRRIFLGRPFNIASWITIGLVIVWAMTFVTAIAAGCRSNLDAWWQSLSKLSSECVDSFSILLAYSVVDVTVDFAILIIPIPLVFRLQMGLRHKFAVCAILATGALSIGCGIARMYYFIVFLAPALRFRTTHDDIGVVTLLMFWGMVELGVAVVAACLPTLGPTLRQIPLQRIFDSVQSAMSVALLRSSRKRSSGPASDHAKSESSSSVADIVTKGGFMSRNHLNPRHYETYAMASVSGQEGTSWNPAFDKIHVENRIHVENEMI